jgi:hypothetical protein
LISRVLAAMVWLTLVEGHSQMTPGHPYALSPAQVLTDANEPMSAAEQSANRKRLRRLNVERRKQIAEDGDKLLRLAADLKVQVDENLPGNLPESVLREAQQIAKLAHAIREQTAQTFSE